MLYYRLDNRRFGRISAEFAAQRCCDCPEGTVPWQRNSEHLKLAHNSDTLLKEKSAKDQKERLKHVFFASDALLGPTHMSCRHIVRTDTSVGPTDTSGRHTYVGPTHTFYSR